MARRAQICEVCGVSFTRTGGSTIQRTCSRQCGVKIWRTPSDVGPNLPVWFRECPQCEALFTAKRYNTVHCGADCRKRAKARYQIAARPQPPYPCSTCGRRLMPTTRSKCADCVAALPTKRAQVRHRRAQREKLNGGLSIGERSDLLHQRKARQLWCQYCFTRKGVELDHVIPLVRGGSNLEGNLILACRSCNAAKAHKTAAEWRYGARLSVRAIAKAA